MEKSLYKNSFLFIFVQVTVHVLQSFEVFWLWTTDDQTQPFGIFSVLLGDQIQILFLC